MNSELKSNHNTMATLSIFLPLILLISLPFSISQTSSKNAKDCNGIFITYDYASGFPIPPNVLASDSNNQAYNFRSTLTILNNSPDELKSWRVFAGFHHREILVSASHAVLADGTTLPGDVGNGTVFAGFPITDLKSAVQTAGDVNQMQARVELVGTQYGVVSPAVPLPSSISLANDGFLCPPSTSQGGWTARVTLFNWGDNNIVDWFAAVQLDKAIQGFEKGYSFNGTIMPDTNNTIFIQGFSGLNYLLAERRGDNTRKDPPVPGTQQSVLSFTKKTTSGIDVGAGDGFPSKVYFNGEECSLPVILPSGSNRKVPLALSAFSLLLTMLVLMVLQLSLWLEI